MGHNAADGSFLPEDRLASMSEHTSEHRNKSGFETRAIHAGYEPDPMTGAVIPPIYATSSYKQDGVGGMRGGYEYSRSANATPPAAVHGAAGLPVGRRSPDRRPAPLHLARSRCRHR